MVLKYSREEDRQTVEREVEMIVKLRTTLIHDEEYCHSAWTYFDGFRKVSQVWYKTMEEMPEFSNEITYYAINRNEKDRLPFMLTCSSKHDGNFAKDDYRIFTNQEAYLLNDEGKTIERLN